MPAMELFMLGSGVQALAIILTEKLLHNVDATEYKIVRYERVWSVFLSSFVVMPIAIMKLQNAGEGPLESTLDTFLMLSRTPKLIGLAIGHIAVITIYNVMGMKVTLFSSATHRNLYESIKSICTWALSVIADDIWPSSGASEPLKK
jgi:hypothetical protein